MSDLAILEALQNAAEAAVNASINPNLPVQFVGRTFTPTTDAPDGKWLELVFIPSNRVNDHWGDEKNYQGLFRMILHWVNDDTGAHPPLELLGSICGYFTKGKLYGGVQLKTLPDVAQPLANGDETLYPATAQYQLFQK